MPIAVVGEKYHRYMKLHQSALYYSPTITFSMKKFFILIGSTYYATLVKIPCIVLWYFGLFFLRKRELFDNKYFSLNIYIFMTFLEYFLIPFCANIVIDLSSTYLDWETPYINSIEL